MNDMLENKMLLEIAAEPQEQDPDEAYDQQRADEDYYRMARIFDAASQRAADLNAELVSIARIQAQTSRIESLTKELQDLLLPRRMK